ncbi:hypothetical protein FRC14_006806 [Serendipita sp. 396]|nr:hypothetical protein FRC14_006806 [Serendipita sp. 396]
MLALSPILANVQIKVMESELVMAMRITSSETCQPQIHSARHRRNRLDTRPLPRLLRYPRAFLMKATGGPEQDDDSDET